MAVLLSQITVFLIGATVIVLAAWGLFVPAKLMTFVTAAIDKPWGMFAAVIVRLLLGAGLIFAAPASPFPVVFQVLGAIAILAAVALVLVGRERLRRFMDWMFGQMSDAFIRLWLLFGIAFGGFLIFGVL